MHIHAALNRPGTVGSRDYAEVSAKEVGVFDVQGGIDMARDAED